MFHLVFLAPAHALRYTMVLSRHAASHLWNIPPEGGTLPFFSTLDIQLPVCSVLNSALLPKLLRSVLPHILVGENGQFLVGFRFLSILDALDGHHELTVTTLRLWEDSKKFLSQRQL
ncbi:MAG: hypothetical protein LBT47_04220 [Deltaproteobacteria bacterium]|nr:hypothetical protein [Deltaproteobacteria bacterium]